MRRIERVMEIVLASLILVMLIANCHAWSKVRELEKRVGTTEEWRHAASQTALNLAINDRRRNIEIMEMQSQMSTNAHQMTILASVVKANLCAAAVCVGCYLLPSAFQPLQEFGCDGVRAFVLGSLWSAHGENYTAFCPCVSNLIYCRKDTEQEQNVQLSQENVLQQQPRDNTL